MIKKKLGTTEDILDLDSSVKTVYGKQEGARKGFNSKSKGKRSYHPQFAFLNSTKECLLAWLRPGDTHSANNADEFLKQALSMIPKGISSLLVRADRGYFDGKLIRVIESYRNVRYLIKVKMRNKCPLVCYFRVNNAHSLLMTVVSFDQLIIHFAQ